MLRISGFQDATQGVGYGGCMFRVPRFAFKVHPFPGWNDVDFLSVLLQSSFLVPGNKQQITAVKFGSRFCQCIGFPFQRLTVFKVVANLYQLFYRVAFSEDKVDL